MALIDFIKAREGYARDNGDGTVSSYWDPNGQVWTIGYGETGPGIVCGTLWTNAQALAALQVRIDRARSQLLVESPGVMWPDGAQDSLTDFVYNEGQQNYHRSTVRVDVLAGNWAGVKQRLLDWEYAGGKKLGGLVTRREDEAAMIELPGL